MDYGFRAMASLLYNYINTKGLDTITSILNTYAPAADKNNPVAYATYITKNTGIPANKKLSTADFKNGNMLSIIRWMARIEQGVMPNETAMQNGYKMFLQDENLI